MSAAPRPDGVLFDMDGVLVDTSSSYRRVIVETVRVVGTAAGLDVSGVDDAWVRAIKQSRGFNNDWDASVALLAAAATPGRDVHRLARAIGDAGGGLGAVATLAGPLPPEWAEHVRAVFQRLYLGDVRFAETEAGPLPSLAGAHDTGPFLDREAPLVSTSALAALAARVPVALATGRPEAEAWYALRRGGWDALFGAVVTHDDCVRAGQPGKPDPWPLVEAARRAGMRGRLWYVGDTPDDMRAARAAGSVPVGVARAADEAHALWNAGAVAVFSATDDACAAA